MKGRETVLKWVRFPPLYKLKNKTKEGERERERERCGVVVR